AYVGIGDRLQNVIDQERFVERRRDLRKEDRVPRRRVRLLAIGEVAVECVPQLMRHRAHIIVPAGIVQQDERMYIVGAARRVSTTSLSGSRVPIDPPLVERSLNYGLVLLSERRDGLPNQLYCF